MRRIEKIADKFEKMMIVLDDQVISLLDIKLIDNVELNGIIDIFNKKLRGR